MAQSARIQPSVKFTVAGGDSITIDDLQSFIEAAFSIGVHKDEPLATSISAPYEYDQRDRSPGSFTITAAPS